MEHLTEIKIRGYHIDFYGHVNNARYLEFLEEGRWDAFESNVDLSGWAARGLVFMAVNININFRQAVGPGETVLVSAVLERVGTKSAVLRQEIILKGSGQIVADALVTFVISDRSGSLVAMEGAILRELRKLEKSNTAIRR